MFNGRPLDFRQLWVDGQKATRARDVEDFENMHRICSVDEKTEISLCACRRRSADYGGKGSVKVKIRRKGTSPDGVCGQSSVQLLSWFGR